MTLQEIFDKAAAHLIAQNACSSRAGNCMYRGPEGRMCAAGPFIPDNKYEPRFEGLAVLASQSDVSHDQIRNEDAIALMDAIGIEPNSAEACLLRGLQMVHDEASNGTIAVRQWPAKLRELAAIWGLNADAVEAALAKRELQRVFDRALEGVRAQGKPAVRGDVCVYYDEGTEARCGVGQALTRAQAMDLQDELDSRGARPGEQGAGRIMPLLTAAGLPDNKGFLIDLQRAHDNARYAPLDRGGFRFGFELKMSRLANMYGLKYTAPKDSEAAAEGGAS